MAPAQWSNLPGDILLIIFKLLTSDLDLLRLRSVCSSWRSSLPSRLNQLSFPLEVPPLFSNSCPLILRNNGARFFLNYSTLYRLSPPADSSDGWLLRVLEVNPNTFSLLTPLLPFKINCPPDMIPESLNLLDYRISEICKCYSLNSVDLKGNVSASRDFVRKVIVLWNYVADCDFIVLVLVSEKDLRYWKFGDEDWTHIDTRGYDFDDVILFDGKCYAVGWKGELVSFDSEFNLTVVSPSNEYLAHNYNNFVIYKSDLYVVSKIYGQEPDEYSSEFEGRYSSADEDEVTNEGGVCSDADEDEYGVFQNYIRAGEDECSDEEISSTEEEEADPAEVPLRMKIFRMSDDCWVYYRYLKDDEIFLSSDDVSVGLSTKDFGGCKGNCVYLAHRRYYAYDIGIEYGDHHGVYDFDKRRTRTVILESAHDRAKIYWPPPDWLRD